MTATPPFYCIAHADFAWPLPDFMTVVGTGSYVPPRGIALSELCPDQAPRNSYLGEYVAMYQIRKILLETKAEGFVGLCHYRRFALPKPLGELHGFNFHTHPDSLAALEPEDFFGDQQTPIVPISVKFPGTVLQQAAYAGTHIGRDLLMYFGDAIDLGIIDARESANFLSGIEFITAPTVAYIPVSWFVEIVHQLELVMSRFYRYHYIEREGYEARNMAFCCERLQAFLLAKKIAAWGADKVISRPLTLLNDSFPKA